MADERRQQGHESTIAGAPVALNNLGLNVLDVLAMEVLRAAIGN